MKLTFWLARDKNRKKKTYLYIVEPQEKDGEYFYSGDYDTGVIGPLPKHYGLKPGECRKVEVQI